LDCKKETEARKVLGLDHFIIDKDSKQMQDAAKSLDYIIDTVSTDHPLKPLISLLKVQGKLVLVGLLENPIYFHHAVVIARKLLFHPFLLLSGCMPYVVIHLILLYGYDWNFCVWGGLSDWVFLDCLQVDDLWGKFEWRSEGNTRDIGVL
jgi:threonine dehydrogenase-like Zn-dependent dehydrogenase